MDGNFFFILTILIFRPENSIILSMLEFITAISSFLLVIVTLIYVFETRKMAKSMMTQAESMKMQSDIMAKEFELKTAPLIKVKSESFSWQLNNKSNATITHTFIVTNHGKFPAIIKEINFDFSLIAFEKYIKKTTKTEAVNTTILSDEEIKLTHTIYIDGEKLLKENPGVIGPINVDNIKCDIVVFDALKREQKTSETYINPKK